MAPQSSITSNEGEIYSIRPSQIVFPALSNPLHADAQALLNLVSRKNFGTVLPRLEFLRFTP